MSEQKSSDFVADLNKGGPYAFPFVAPGALCLGMTLRDYFAAKALVALFACEANPRVGRDVEPYNCGEDHRKYAAKESYAIADAMLAARSAA